jgi:hypothetical protein
MDATPPTTQLENLSLESPTSSIESAIQETEHQTNTTTENTTHPSAPSPTTIVSIADIKANKGPWYKLHVFIFDLRNFREVPNSQARLNSVVDAPYIGLPYFTPEEVALLKSTRIPISALSSSPNLNPKSNSQTSKAEDAKGEEYKTLEEVIEETLNERLERRIKKRVKSGDFKVCAAHDLAPVFERAFGVKEKELGRNERFKEVLGRCGLKLREGEDEQWEKGGKGKEKR